MSKENLVEDAEVRSPTMTENVTSWLLIGVFLGGFLFAVYMIYSAYSYVTSPEPISEASETRSNSSACRHGSWYSEKSNRLFRCATRKEARDRDILTEMLKSGQ